MRVRALVLAGLAAFTAVSWGCSSAPESSAPEAALTVTADRAEAVAGGVIDLTYRFEVRPAWSSRPDGAMVFVHFAAANGELLWTDDHPLASPTTQWKPGATIQYTRTAFIPVRPHNGPVAVRAGLYRPQSGERISLAGTHDGTRAYDVARFVVRDDPHRVFLVFREGWFGTEVSDDGALESQWSGKEAVLSFRNPRQPVTLFLRVDQPLLELARPQRAVLSVGGRDADTFDLDAGNPQVRRLALDTATLGNADTVDVRLSVSQAFVPADLPGVTSTDRRELGIRVLAAHLEPRQRENVPHP
jgi:hypothetical protein